MTRISTLALCAFVLIPALRAQHAAVFAEAGRIFENYRLDAHIPGMVFGIVIDGRLVHVQAMGVQDIESKRPVTADTLFRIASMTKSFTALSILALRDQGKLALDSPAEAYVPELRNWRYPTADSARIRVRELLTHTAGFVTDDPWGDRQTPLSEESFTRMLREGIPFTRPPAIAMEYSNLGYALLGRIAANVSGEPYHEFVRKTLLGPLGMASSGYEVTKAPAHLRAQGYRWEDAAWRLEPTMAHGAFGAMGGLQTSANDYARYVAFLTAAWPPRDDADPGPVKRSSARELAQGANYPEVRERPGKTGATACRQAATYGMGMWVIADCELGVTLSHGGGYPGYGSFVLILPAYRAGIFVFANRTYAGPRPPVWDTAMVLLRAGLLQAKAAPVSSALASAYASIAKMFQTGSVTAAGDVLAMNFLMDRSAENWSREIASLKAQTGACSTDAPIEPTGALSGSFTWICEHGRVRGSVLLAPTAPPRIQEWKLARENP